jgi:hypothetical protein
MPERIERGRLYWHCHACDTYVPREQERCACGAPKVRRGEAHPQPRPLDRAILWPAGAILLLGGLGLLWLLLGERL